MYDRNELIEYCKRHPLYKFITKDKDGTIVAFENEPICNEDLEIWQSGNGAFGSFKGSNIGDIDWKESLIRVYQ